MLYHVSETPGIELFEPRIADSQSESLVWAIGEARLHNYLLPRDCPRVTYCAKVDSSTADISHFLGRSRAVVAVESAWADRIRTAVLYCYEMPSENFICIDEGAGYFTNTRAVAPRRVQVVTNSVQAIRDRDVELRFLPNLQELSAAIVTSTLQFSLIRMRNAEPKCEGRGQQAATDTA